MCEAVRLPKVKIFIPYLVNCKYSAGILVPQYQPMTFLIFAHVQHKQAQPYFASTVSLSHRPTQTQCQESSQICWIINFFVTAGF